MILLCLLILPQTIVLAKEKESLEEFAGTDTLWQNIPDEIDADSLRELLEANDASSLSEKISF